MFLQITTPVLLSSTFHQQYCQHLTLCRNRHCYDTQCIKVWYQSAVFIWKAR